MTSWDYTKIMNRSEILAYLKENYWMHTPKKTDIEWWLNSKRIDKNLDEQDKLHTTYHTNKDKEKDRHKRLVAFGIYLSEMEKLDEEWNKLNKESTRLLNLKCEK